jgi:hypothetical protein
VNVYELAPRFAALFDGLKMAHGTGEGRWVKRPLRPEDWVKHLQGVGPGIGVAPLREDNTVMFAAIDLDEPDFESADLMRKFLPGKSWLEKSRSGNAHVWVFFAEPCPAWIAMGVLKEAYLAAGKEQVEVFPKNWDFARVRLGNYINLPYHGSQRAIYEDWNGKSNLDYPLSLEDFISQAEETTNEVEKWVRRANWLQIHDPSNRKDLSTEWGTQARLHSCAERIISGEAGPIVEGTRNAVFFMLAKCLLNWQDCDSDEALEILRAVNNDLCDPPEDDYELRRILGNVERARYTSTGCDDPLVQPYTDPACPIAHPRR